MSLRAVGLDESMRLDLFHDDVPSNPNLDVNMYTQGKPDAIFQGLLATLAPSSTEVIEIEDTILNQGLGVAVILPGLAQIELKSSTGGHLFVRFPDFTRPRFPPRTIQEKFSNLADDSTDIVTKLESGQYTEAIRGLDSLKVSIRNIILYLPAELPPEILPTDIGLLLNSLEYCSRVLLEGMRQGNVVETIQENEIMRFLQGVKRTLEDFSNVEEWRQRMRERGGNTT